MCKTRILLALFAAIAVFGMAASGCNNNKTTAMRSNKQSSRNVRPAEVLSASAYRPPVRSAQPLPAPVAAPVYTRAPAYSAAPAAAYSPSLAMAYPAAQASAYQQPRVAYQPPVAQPTVLAGAPIPELEPARFARVVNRRPAQRPVAEVMMTARPIGNGDRQEVIKALSPITPVTPVASTNQRWVASPVTAMNNHRAVY